MAVGLAMLTPRRPERDSPCRLDLRIAARLSVLGCLAGLVSGFFGIGGGFLIVPGLMVGSGMSILSAIGCSLVSVTVFGLATAINYALSGLVDWWIALEFIAGGALGGYFGMNSAVLLARHKQALTHVFVAIVFALAAYIMLRTGPGLFAA
jgi:uncharacterized membrane protein YfcA